MTAGGATREYQTEAIVLSVRDWQEADRLVTLFTLETGKVAAIAYGARRTKSRLAGSVQLFAYLDASLAAGAKLDTLRQCTVKNSFRPMRNDLEHIAYGSLVAEATSELFGEKDCDPDLFYLLLQVFELMTVRNPRIAANAAVWQILSRAGFHPEYDHCVSCGGPLDFPAWFSPRAGGAVCSHCTQGEEEPLSQEVHHFLTSLDQLDWRSPGSFSVSGAVLMQSEKILTRYLLFCLDKPLKSLAFLQQVTNGS